MIKAGKTILPGLRKWREAEQLQVLELGLDGHAAVVAAATAVGVKAVAARDQVVTQVVDLDIQIFRLLKII